MEDLGEQVSKGQQNTSNKLQCNRVMIAILEERGRARGRLTALMKTLSARVWCFAMANSTMTTATSAGLRVLTGSMFDIVQAANGVEGRTRGTGRASGQSCVRWWKPHDRTVSFFACSYSVTWGGYGSAHSPASIKWDRNNLRGLWRGAPQLEGGRIRWQVNRAAVDGRGP